MAGPKVTVRMYNVGFGDAFLVTVAHQGGRWRMLVDCGVHSQGIATPIDQVVQAIIGDLADPEHPAAKPHLDVVVASHRHADHILGFADKAWDGVDVDQVWLPWVEDRTDPQAVELQRDMDEAANRLAGLAATRLTALAGAGRSGDLATAKALAENAKPNQVALNRLRGSTRGFVAPSGVRYLPHGDEATTVLATGIDGVRVHVLGPTRDDALLKRMDPPKDVEWLLGMTTDGPRSSGSLFDGRYRVTERSLKNDRRHRFDPMFERPAVRGGLDGISDDAIVLGASKLESWCNNTSLFLVLEVGDRRLIFPGDAQQGAWEHVLADESNLALLRDADFYKISHHGSHNGTPRRFVEEVLEERRITMLPYGEVKRWTKIPKGTLLEGLSERKHQIVRSDAPAGKGVRLSKQKGLWCEVSV
jgi:beta-lactamase superfamily II metal-dependent hydrolase